MSERFIIVADWIPPAFGAVGQYMEQRARNVAATGRTVVLIGLGMASSSETQPLGQGEYTRICLAASRNPKHSLWRRTLWTLRTNWFLLRETARAQAEASQCTILVTGSPPFFAYMCILMNALIWRRQLIYRITDFYPETVLATGKARWLYTFLPLFRLMRRHASRIEVLGEDQKRRLADDGVRESRIDLVRDNCPITHWEGAQRAPRPFGPDEIILLYSGNMGLAHEIDTFCEAYRRHVHEGSDRVRLWINGVGARVPVVRDFCRRHNLPVHITDPVPLEDLPGVLLAADAHLVLLDTNFWGYVLPSKIYACLEAGQPIVYVGPRQSDIYLLLDDRGAPSWQIQPGDIEACVASLEALAARRVIRMPEDVHQ